MPTPRGGGLAIVTVALGCAIAIPGLAGFDMITVALIGAGAVVAAVGYVDDLKGLSARVRLIVHAAAAAVVVALLVQRHGSSTVSGLPTPIAVALLVMIVVWSTNLFNFMDGIDGLAASEAFFIAGAGAGLLGLVGGQPTLWSGALVTTAGACLGFLVWNWPPARIFMGDVGSGFLGFWLGAIAVALHVTDALSIWTSLTLGSVFIADATVTLLRRVLSGQKWYAAHRSHAYQRLARRFGNHRAVTSGTVAINVIVVLPVAWATRVAPGFAPLLAIGIVGLLAAVCWKLGAGLPDQQPV